MGPACWLSLGGDPENREARPATSAQPVPGGRWGVLAVMAGCAVAIALIYPHMRQEPSPPEDRGGILANNNAPHGGKPEYTGRQARQPESHGPQDPPVRRHIC